MAIDSVRASLHPLEGLTPSLEAGRTHESAVDKNSTTSLPNVEVDSWQTTQLSDAEILALAGSYPPMDSLAMPNEATLNIKNACIAAVLGPLGSI